MRDSFSKVTQTQDFLPRGFLVHAIGNNGDNFAEEFPLYDKNMDLIGHNDDFRYFLRISDSGNRVH